MNIKTFVDGLIPWIQREIAPLTDRLVALEKRAPEKGERGADGSSVVLADVMPAINEIISRKMADIPRPENGVRGEKGDAGADGKSVTVDDVLPAIEEKIAEKMAEIPIPKDGIDGKHGKDADIEQIKSLVDEAVSKIELPKDGDPGKDGVDGKSVDEVEVRSLISDVVAIAIEQIEIPKPKDGKDGVDGKSFTAEEVQKMVDEAVSKAISAIKPAENGRDALDLEILPAIDEQKSYPRGTYALHKSGLFRSYQITTGMKGWECIVAGLDDIDFEQIDERNFKVKMVRSNGVVVEKTCSSPVMIYKNIYKQGNSYQKGDVVTFGSSSWHCNKDTTEKPGHSDDWSLSVKKGLDGKSA